MVLFIPVAESMDDMDRFVHARRLDIDGLEASLQRTVFFDMLSVFIQRCGADTLDFAARERRFQHVGRIDRPLCGPRPDERVQFVDEDNDVAGLHDLFHHDFQPFLELPPILCSGDKRAQVQRDHSSREEIVRHVRRDDPLGQAFHDRCLADP